MSQPYFDPDAGADHAGALLERVRDALARRAPLRIVGGDSKAFLGRPVAGEPLALAEHRGIVAYDPCELVITARAGTPLDELQAVLARGGQMLACEAPGFGGRATVGGVLASGLSGPRRPWAGAVRDFVLGTRLISGLGTHLRFGGEVMKNVAGYDLSRLLAGSFGCLGVVTEVSFKVLPMPRCQAGLSLDLPVAMALRKLAEWGGQPLPISAACHDGEALRLRLEGGEGSVRSARDRLGGEALDDGFWADLREQRLPFFDDPRPLWRLSLPALAPETPLPGRQLLDWGGALRWLKSDAPAADIRAWTAAHGGHATCYRAGHLDAPFQPLSPGLLGLHRALKRQARPAGHLQSRADVRRTLRRRDANQPLRFRPATRRGRRSRAHPAQLRALRFLQRHLPDLPGAGRRTRRPARTDLPDQAVSRARRGQRAHSPAPRSLPEPAATAKPPARPESSTTSCWISAATSSPNACRAASGNACCATGCACWPRARGCSARWPALPGG